MSNIEELKDVLKESLEEKGVLNKARSILTNDIFKNLTDKEEEKQETSKENKIINEIIKEYLEYNNYHYSNSTFSSESNHPKEGIKRNDITNKIGIIEDNDTKKVPLIYSWVFDNKKFTKEN